MDDQANPQDSKGKGRRVPWTMHAIAAALVIIIVAYAAEWYRRLFGG